MKPFEAGTLAIDRETHVVHIRSRFSDYWYSSNAMAVGRMLFHDERVTPEKFEIIRPEGRW